MSVPLDVERPNPFLTHRYELLTAGGEWAGSVDTEGGPRYEREALSPGDTVTSGDLLEVELQLETRGSEHSTAVLAELSGAAYVVSPS